MKNYSDTPPPDSDEADEEKGGNPNRENNHPRQARRGQMHDNLNRPAAADAGPVHTNYDGSDNPKSRGRFADKVARLQKSHNLSFDAACTKLIRDERGW